MPRILLTGWFSFEQMGATAGDLLARDVVAGWLGRQAIAFDVALAPPFIGGVDWQTVEPARYSHVIFVCGPFGNGEPVTGFLLRFAHCRLIGVDLTMLDTLESWNPFDLLLERDSSRAVRPDLAFLAPHKAVPVVGISLIHPQSEYGVRDIHRDMNDAIEALAAEREMAVVRIDTRLDENRTGLRTPDEIDALFSRMDLVLTTRLHGLVLSLRNGVPAVALDPVKGGAKISRQAEVLGWPCLLTDATMKPGALHRLFDYCRTEEARILARETARRAADLLSDVEPAVLRFLRS